MGSFIRLGIGELEIDWGKNYSYTDYSGLFRSSDKTVIPYYYADNQVIIKPGYSSPLSQVKRRLELMGFSLKNLEIMFNQYNDDFPLYYNRPNIDFNALLKIFSNISIADYKNKKEDGDYDLGEYVVENIFKNPIFSSILKYVNINDKESGTYFQNFNPLFIIRLLMENPSNLDLTLDWRTQDLVEGGYYTDEEIYRDLNEVDKFLIVTEGSSDLFIIKKTLELLYPDILDFFTFVDMEKNYPFTGTGNLYRFCEGLTSIRIQNKTLIIFDNDVEGDSNYKRTMLLNLPPNMKVMKLPELEEFKKFKTIGPTGETFENINGKAVAIECFLDFAGIDPKVRWTSYQKDSGDYQGSLENKDSYVKKFKKVKDSTMDYNFSKLAILIDEIYNRCIE